MANKWRQFALGAHLPADLKEKHLEEQANKLLRYTWLALIITAAFQVYNMLYALVYTGWTLRTASSKVYMVLYICLFVFTIIGIVFRFRAVKHSYPPQRVLRMQIVYITFLMFWTLAITLYDQRKSNSLNLYVSMLCVLSILTYLTPLQAGMIFGVPHIILLFVLPILPFVEGDRYGELLSSTIIAIMSIFVSVYRFYMENRSFAERQTILRQNEEVRKKNELLNALAQRDALTGLYNRRFFDNQIPLLFEQACQKKQPVSIFMADIDDFKAYNDCYGHQKGDQCLHLVAQALDVQMSKGYLLRYGGEEFCGIAPDMGRPEAMEEGVRYCRAVEALKLSTMEPERYVTISIGVYTAVPTDRDSWREMLSRADRALYAAKKGGKNRASYYEENGDNFSTE